MSELREFPKGLGTLNREVLTRAFFCAPAHSCPVTPRIGHLNGALTKNATARLYVHAYRQVRTLKHYAQVYKSPFN